MCVHVCVHACMHAWMDACMDGCVDGWKDGWNVSVSIYIYIYLYIYIYTYAERERVKFLVVVPGRLTRCTDIHSESHPAGDSQPHADHMASIGFFFSKWFLPTSPTSPTYHPAGVKADPKHYRPPVQPGFVPGTRGGRRPKP